MYGLLGCGEGSAILRERDMYDVDGILKAKSTGSGESEGSSSYCARGYRLDVAAERGGEQRTAVLNWIGPARDLRVTGRRFSASSSDLRSQAGIFFTTG